MAAWAWDSAKAQDPVATASVACQADSLGRMILRSLMPIVAYSTSPKIHQRELYRGLQSLKGLKGQTPVMSPFPFKALLYTILSNKKALGLPRRLTG